MKVLAKFAAAAAELGNLAPNDSGNYGKFVNLAALLEAATPVLVRHGVNVVQITGSDGEGNATVRTLVVDLESGEHFDIGFFAGKAPDSQKAGGVYTYGRRYSLAAALGVSSDQDLDKAPKPAVRRSKPSNDQPSVTRPNNRVADGAAPAALVRSVTLMFKDMDREEKLAMYTKRTGRPITSGNELTTAECKQLLTISERGSHV
jgi:hypothetical protein